MFTDATLASFADETAARTPTPGGGSVVAYIGALGAALGLMAARFTEGRKGFEEHQDALAREIDRLEAIRGQLTELIESDATAYGSVTAAYELPRGSDEEKAARKAAIQTALGHAMEVPLQTCRIAVQGLEVLEQLRHHTNPNLASDVAVGAYALAATCRGAWVNVLINLSGLKDADRGASVTAEGEQLLQSVARLEASVAGTIVDGLGG